MKIQKKYLEVFVKALVATSEKLGYIDGRIRDKFLKSLMEILQDYTKSRDTLLKDLATPVPEKEGHFQPTEEYIKELEILNAEEVELPTEPKIKEFLEVTDYKPKIGESDLLDELIKLI